LLLRETPPILGIWQPPLLSFLAASNSTRGLSFGGQTYNDGDVNTITYITIASAGNSTDFGDLLATRVFTGATAGSTRAVVAGGQTVNVIYFVTISTTGNATDFGDLTTSRFGLAACSSAHGGLS
jgi:hypothetical protein